jgi:TusE/DsrC/DsvC family sulfur relay protein
MTGVAQAAAAGEEWASAVHRVRTLSKEEAMSMETNIEMPARDAEGYLVEPAQWNAEVATLLADEQGITLEADHWDVLRFMREFYEEHQVAADARFTIRHLDQHYPGQGRKRLFELFPYGYVAQACKLAGMKRPRAWSTG